MSLSGTFIISSFTNFASTVIEAWKAWKGSKNKNLDQEQARILQEAQHNHEIFLEKFRFEKELLLEKIKTESQASKLSPIDLGNDFLERLEFEAEVLSNMDYVVIFEPVGDGYGLTLPMNPETVIVFWISNQYPQVEPQIFIKTNNTIDRIDFEAGVWEPYFTLGEIVQSLSTGND
ncbi:hypothetical protein QUF90_17065 [Desulfococcaceae bacterium HSG9]|nr:hypothetical protein [Desulfococcaceae bacterium HSG9]